jgi:hypothetical protein
VTWVGADAATEADATSSSEGGKDAGVDTAAACVIVMGSVVYTGLVEACMDQPRMTHAATVRHTAMATSSQSTAALRFWSGGTAAIFVRLLVILTTALFSPNVR